MLVFGDEDGVGQFQAGGQGLNEGKATPPLEHPSSQVACLGKGRHRAPWFCSKMAAQKDSEVS